MSVIVQLIDNQDKQGCVKKKVTGEGVRYGEPVSVCHIRTGHPDSPGNYV